MRIGFLVFQSGGRIRATDTPPLTQRFAKPSRSALSALQTRISFPWLRESYLDAFPTGGIMLGGLGKRRLIGGVVVSLLITLLLSLGAVYGLNRYLGPVEEPGWATGSLRR
jgi:hypothetical protein